MSVQNDWLLKNPFYLLNVSCTDNRRRITAAADELGLLLDADECSNAQNALLNPAKRLTAELDWFVDCDFATIATIRNNIETHSAISERGLSSLAALNAALYNFSLAYTKVGSKFIEQFLQLSILDIDKKFGAVDEASLTATINQNRELAQMARTTEQDVSLELEKKRTQIRHILNEGLSSLSNEIYIPFVTLLARNYVEAAEERDPAALADIIDQYELRMQAEIEKATQDIETYIDRIKRLGNNDAFQSNIQTLITRVKNWDVLVQPLQLKSKASGMPHRTSERLGYNLRNLVLFLSNDKGLHGDALSLASAMLEVFAEIAALATLFKTDADALRKLVPDQKTMTPAVVPANKNLPDAVPATPSAEKAPKTKRRFRLLVAALVILGCLNIYQYCDYSNRLTEKNAIITEKNSKIDALEKEKLTLNEKVTSYGDDIRELKAELDALRVDSSAAKKIYNGLTSFLSSGKASSYNKSSNFFANTNIVVVEAGEKTTLSITTKNSGTVWFRTESGHRNVDAAWSKHWNNHSTTVNITGKYGGETTLLKFYQDGVSTEFYVLVIVTY